VHPSLERSDLCVTAATYGHSGAHPEVTLSIEVHIGRFVYYCEKIDGVSGGVACLLSCGFDSPIAIWTSMPRFAQADSLPIQSEKTSDER
jgi:adenylyl- and sulfurtransferase ThiI